MSDDSAASAAIAASDAVDADADSVLAPISSLE
jgi:hypothetical protein